MGRSTVHYADNATNNILKRLHNKLRPAGTPVQRVEYIIELLLLRIFEVKLKQDREFEQLRKLFIGENEDLLFSSLYAVPNEQILPALNTRFFPFYARILSEARKVYSGNPKEKVQDQLVLIEEVFSNSNFTNNVNSGNLREVVGLVGELDEQRLLKTDLLGDAIESALSETGGTKDIGLFRTPDHVRQFMVGLVAPTFADQMFDPTAGTGGFLFDGFEYVMESATRDGKWPGPRAHPELVAWYKDHFAKKTTRMPSVEVATDFYRTGVTGIEYLGVIRKMAAINFYIRGLNPANMAQGDSLAMFKKKFDPESKTAILANPPFGAERDQEAYPDVWAEYPKESETTILFVKLMFEALKKAGRCAVIVSEGFMTWDQNSARALRKTLLDEANLKAIISLPQGVFVSKGGQGPKTSILYFEKGGPTEIVWFYKVTNDGFTMGTNRKPIVGCQLVEALDLFDRYVRRGEVPPETRHSFTIPAEWIKALDPRFKEKIRTETRAELTTKAEEERKKLFDGLNGRLADGKVKSSEMDARLEQHEQLWQARIQNEIGRRIERAHLYSFNLPNYRGTLTPAQMDAWATRTGNRVEERKGTYLDERYECVKKARPDELDNVLSGLDPRNTLELDIAREALDRLSADVFQTHPHLRALADMLASQHKYPRVKLGPLLRLNIDSVRPANSPDARFRVLGVSNETGVFMNETLLGSEIRQAYYRVKPGEFCYNPYRVNVGSIGLNEFDFDNQIISGAYVVFGTNLTELRPQFLLALLKSPQFLAYVNEKAHGGVRMNFKFEYLCDWEVPLPSPEEQDAIVASSARVFELISGAERISNVLGIEQSVFAGPELSISEFAEIGTGSTPSRSESKYFGGTINWVLTAEVNESEISSTTETLTDDALLDYGLKVYPVDTILVAMYGQGKTRGKAALLKCPAAITQNCAGIVLTRDDVLPKYVYYYLRSIYELIRGQDYSGGGVPHLNLKIIAGIRVPIPAKDIQKVVVERIDRDMRLLEELQRVKAEASARIEKVLSGVWNS